MAFDIASVLKDVSGMNTGREEITYLSLDILDPDENNFYSLDGLNELAGNIELIGLQQPLRVRPGSDGHYVIVSGHRRRAACQMIRDGGSDQFADGIPCIIEYGEASAAMRELRLIYANAATRVMTSSEISQQAKRVEELLYQLKEEGVEFPGRMRDHVAAACQVSKTKIARLHAIRNNLAPELLESFDKGQLNESAAYELQKLPEDAQAEIAASVKRSGNADWIRGDAVEHCVRYADAYYKDLTCPDDEACDYHEKRFVQALRSDYTWARCSGGCCLDCGRMMECSHGCTKARAKRKTAQEERKEERTSAEEDRKRAEAEKQRIRKENWQADAKRILPLIEAAGMKDRDELPSAWYGCGVKMRTVRDYAGGEFGSSYFHYESFLPRDVDDLKAWADRLGCSLDFLAGRADQPRPSETTGGGWCTGTPTDPGMYETRVGILQEETTQAATWQRLEWVDHDHWAFPVNHAPLPKGTRVYRWHKLPEV